MESQLGRRFIIGDVLEFPHLKDISVTGNVAPKLYEVARVMKAPTGWDARYTNHILGLILRPVRDQQEFIQIMERKDQYGKTVADQVSVAMNILKMNEALADKAAELAPQSVRNTEDIFVDPDNKKKGIDMWTDDGQAPDGIYFDKGPEFPLNPTNFDYFLRTDMYPNRMYQFYEGIWNTKQKDTNLKWQPYAWVRELQVFLSQPKSEHK